jgi:predicted amidohydrolase
MSSTEFTVASIQLDVLLGDLEANIDKSVAAIRSAAGLGAKLVVLPECASSGWNFDSPEESARYAQPLDGGPTIEAWKAIARERDIHIVAGFSEATGGAPYNSSVLIGPNGVESLYRKVHLWNREKKVFTPGDLGFPVADTPLGRIGMVICYDSWFPESYRSCAMRGADLVCAPSDWIEVPGQPEGALPLAHLMAMTSAHSNQLYVAAASRVGEERGTSFIGSSVIVDYTGWALAGGDVVTGETIITATIDPIGSRPARIGDPFNQPLSDRRPEFYLMKEI